MFPANVPEILIFAVCIIFYGILASCIAVNYRIVFDNRIPWDAYFSFDNRAIVMTGGGFERHPLSVYFFDVLRSLALLISGNRYDALFRLTLSWASVITVSLTMVQIYKYLRNIIRLPDSISLLLVLFFGISSTPILLSFTPETYTYTLFLLTFYNYYAARKIQYDQKTSTAAVTFAGIAAGGLTITNIVKIYIPVLFEKHIFSNWKIFLSAAGKVAFSSIIFLFLFLWRLNFDYQKIFAKTGQQYEKFSNPKVTPLWDMASSWFIGGNVLFPGFITRDYHNKKGFEYKALFMDTYSSAVPYLFVFTLGACLCWSWMINFRNKLLQILVLSFAVDIVIHVVLKFGLHTSYIYGGHFVFVFPLMLGWLFHAYKRSPLVLSLLFGLIITMVVYLAVNNLFRLQEFFFFLEKFYQ